VPKDQCGLRRARCRVRYLIAIGSVVLLRAARERPTVASVLEYSDDRGGAMACDPAVLTTWLASVTRSNVPAAAPSRGEASEHQVGLDQPPSGPMRVASSGPHEPGS
jgi:hypothetical protein